MQTPITPAEHHSTPPRPQPAEVKRAVSSALASGSIAELERLVREYVRVLRDADLPPEQALKRVKDVVGAAHGTPVPGHVGQPDVLSNDVVKWFVAEYYRAD